MSVISFQGQLENADIILISGDIFGKLYLYLKLNTEYLSLYRVECETGELFPEVKNKV